MSISGSKAPVPWSNDGDDDWTSVGFNHLMDSGGFIISIHFYFSPQRVTPRSVSNITLQPLPTSCSKFTKNIHKHRACGMAEKTPKPPTFPKCVTVWRSFCPPSNAAHASATHTTLVFFHSWRAKALEDCRHRRRRSQCGIRSSQGQVVLISISHVTPNGRWWHWSWVQHLQGWMPFSNVFYE